MIHNGAVYVGDYIIHENGYIEVLDDVEPLFDPIEDIVRFPGSVMKPGVRKYLRDRGFWMESSSTLHLTLLPGIKIGHEVITDGKNTIFVDMMTGKLFDAFGRNWRNIVELLDEYFKLVDDDNEFLYLGPDGVQFDKVYGMFVVVVQAFSGGLRVFAQSVYHEDLVFIT